MFVDSHCHLDLSGMSNDIDNVITRALHSGVSHLHTICVQIVEIEKLLEIANARNNIFCSVGNHPLYLMGGPITMVADILKYCALPKVISIGETGLDYFHDGFDKKRQIESFRMHIQASQISGLPLVIHTRSADEDTVAIIKEHMSEKLFCGVIHCFTASKWLADEVIDMGFYISASGIITFKNSDAIKDVFRLAPEDRILIETDSPFLTPVPLRGKPNEPSYLKYIAETLAELKGTSVDNIAQITTSNFFKLFSKAVIQ